MVESHNPRDRGRPDSGSDEFAIPEGLRLRLVPWIDIDEVGAAGFWRWLETVLPLLPAPGPKKDSASRRGAQEIERMQELARDLVDCAGDRARLTIACERYFSDNRALSIRVKALEAAVRSFQRSGMGHGIDGDAETGAIAERYLPHR